MYAKPGQTLRWIAVVSDPEIGELMNADSTPTGVLYKNLAAQGTTVTVTNLSTGIYGVSVTVPNDWVAADVGSVVLTAVIDAMNFGASVEFVVDTKRTSDLQDLSQSQAQSACASALTAYDPPTNAEMEARTILSSNYATSSAVSAIASVLSGITSLAAWLRALARSSAADSTAKSEINSGGGTYDEATDSLEAHYGVLVASAAVTTVSTGEQLTIHRGDRWVQNFTVGAITDRSKLWFTIKTKREDADTEAKVQITEAGGLIRFNGAAADTAAHGAITVTNATTGAITITLHASKTALLAVDSVWVYDIQVLRTAADGPDTLSDGACQVEADVTRATS